MNLLLKSGVTAFLALSLPLAAKASGDKWFTSYNQAVKESKKTGKPIMADFTGSDWCHWCIQLHHEVFDTPEFKKWAAKSVVLLELDYPHATPQPDEIRKQNQDMLRKYPYIRGYPTILFIKPDGTAFGQYGYDRGGPAHWTEYADRLLKPKAANPRALRFAPSDDSYPAPVTKKLYATNDLRGKTAPKFTVQQWLTGKAPDMKGKVVLIDFWATWCPPCRELVTELNGWKKKFGDDLVIIGVSDEKAAAVESFMKTKPMNYNVAIDPNETMMKAIDIQGIPHVLVITPDHIVRWQGFPQSDEEQLTDKLLKQIIDTSKKQTAASRS